VFVDFITIRRHYNHTHTNNGVKQDDSAIDTAATKVRTASRSKRGHSRTQWKHAWNLCRYPLCKNRKSKADILTDNQITLNNHGQGCPSIEGKTMYQVIYRFKDSAGKTRKTALVTYHTDHYIAQITGTASEYQVFVAIDGCADSVGKLTITSQYVGD